MTPFTEAHNPAMDSAFKELGIKIECWINDVYEVWVYRKKNCEHILPISAHCDLLNVKLNHSARLVWVHISLKHDQKNGLVGVKRRFKIRFPFTQLGPNNFELASKHWFNSDKDYHLYYWFA